MKRKFTYTLRPCADRERPVQRQKPNYCNPNCSCFEQGQVLLVPLHVTNRDPSLSLNDRELEMSSVGPVFSKYRRVVVFRKFQTQMECLPLYTNNGKGVTQRPEKELKEWMPVVSEPETDSPQSLALSYYARDEVKKNSCLHVTESVMVDYTENVQWLGKMMRSSFERLHKRRAALDESARG